MHFGRPWRGEGSRRGSDAERLAQLEAAPKVCCRGGLGLRWIRGNQAAGIRTTRTRLPQEIADQPELDVATRNANGTGPFKLVSREADVRTVVEVNPDWWDNPNKVHNLTKVTLTPIAQDATRVAALLSGQVDMAYPVPVQDMQRVNSDADTSVLVGPELRTIFLHYDKLTRDLARAKIRLKAVFRASIGTR